MADVNTSDVISYIGEVANKYGVDPTTAKRLFLSENMGKDGSIPSTLSEDVTSKAGAYGVMQVKPSTHEGLKRTGVLPSDHTMDDWKGQVEAGVAALKDLQRQHKTTDPDVLAAAYNGGNKAAAAAKAGDFDALPPETKDYLAKSSLANTMLGNRPAAPSQRDVRLAESPIPVQMAVGDTSNIGENTAVRATDAFEQVFKNTKTIMDNLISDITSSTKAEAAARNSQADAIITAGKAAGDEAAAAASLKATTANTRQKILTTLNIDPNVTDSLISSMLARFQTLDDERQPLKAEIDARQSIGFFDNPVQYLANQTRLPGMINQYNAIARDQNESLERINVAEGIAKAADETMVGPTADQYTQYGIAATNLAAAKANADAEGAKAEAASATARKVLGIAHIIGTEGTMAMQAVQYNLLAGARQEKIDASEALRKERDTISNQLSLVGKTIGAPNITFTDWQKMSAAEREAWSTRMRTSRLGDNLSESIPFILKYGNLSTMANTGSAEIAKTVSDIEKEARKSAELLQSNAATRLNEKKPREYYMPDAYRILQEGIETARDTNLMAAPPTNPYVANHFATTMAWKGNPNNTVYKTVSTAAKAKVSTLTDKTVLETVTKLVGDGKLTASQAANDVSEYYSEVIKRNNANRGLSLLGLPAQTNYVVLPNDAKLRVNLSNRAEVENYLLGTQIKDVGWLEGLTMQQRDTGEADTMRAYGRI